MSGNNCYCEKCQTHHHPMDSCMHTTETKTATVNRGLKKMQRNRVWCIQCGQSRSVDSVHALRNGWPKCCGYTMTIDSPEERAKNLALG